MYCHQRQYMHVLAGQHLRYEFKSKQWVLWGQGIYLIHFYPYMIKVKWWYRGPKSQWLIQNGNFFSRRPGTALIHKSPHRPSPLVLCSTVPGMWPYLFAGRRGLHLHAAWRSRVREGMKKEEQGLCQLSFKEDTQKLPWETATYTYLWLELSHVVKARCGFWGKGCGK